MTSQRMILPIIAPRVARFLAALAVTATFGLATSAIADDSDWPREVDSSSGTIVVYQPQAEDLDGDVLTSRAAFSLQKRGESSPTFGVLWFTERISIDRDSSTVNARSLDVTKVRLPGITASDASHYEQVIETEATRWDLSGSLDELRAGLAATEKERASVADLSNAPPKIRYVPERAFLVGYDGAPVLEPIEGTRFQRVSNTPYAVVFDPDSRRYFLSGANLWYAARDPLGPWSDIPGPPPDVRAIVPPDTSTVDVVSGPAPRVVTATEPTELISTDGPARYSPLVGSELLYVSNSESDVVREVSSQAIYVLLAGRWFRARSFDGPWTFVRPDQLPASFQRIPPDSPKGNILASVAGTDQADDAVADAEIPQTSAIRRDASDFEATYDGPPQFEDIEGTHLQYAINTDAEIILADGRYYACDQGVWYVADSPDGPWSVSETRPLGIDDIPPSCPVYNVRYVYVFDTSPDVIYTGYLPGYVGCYPSYGTVFYGTGYHYRPWRRHHYYPRPCTWGFNACYNPWLSRWSFGFSYNAGFLRIGTRWRPMNGPARRERAPMWFGPGGYRRPLLADDRTPLRRRPPRVRPGLEDRAPVNLYNRTENAKRVDREAVRMPMRRVGILAPRPARLPNNVFAGKDGKVYQRDPGGNWKVNDGRNWQPTHRPDTPVTPSPNYGNGDRGAQGPSRPAERPYGRPSPPTPRETPRYTPPSPQPTPTPRETPRQYFPPPQQQPPRESPRPTPVAPRQEPPRFNPPSRPAPPPPTISPTPGNLEREFHARERGGQGGPRGAMGPARPAPAPPPQQKERDRSQEKPREKRDH